jgi:hypothetical protein
MGGRLFFTYTYVNFFYPNLGRKDFVLIRVTKVYKIFYDMI